MPNKEMDEFLAVAPEPVPAAEPPVAEAVIEAPVEAVPAEGAPPVEPPKPPEVAAADGEPEDVKGLRSALVAERKQRQDYKGERDRLQGEVAALKAQIDAVKAPQPAPQPQPPVQQEPPKPPPNPAEDPQGFMVWQEHRLFNERLNMSEAMLRQQHGDEDVEAKIAVFKEAAASNPALLGELRNQAHPYRFAYDMAQRMLAMKEIGPDPKAYETKLREQIEAEVRAKIEAEFANAPMATAPQPPRLPQSLGTARSAAPRTEAVEEAPPFEQMFGPKRKRA